MTPDPTWAGPDAKWLLKQANTLRRTPLHFFQALAGEFGDRVRFRMGRTAFHLVSDPALIKDLLITQGPSFEKFPRIARQQGLFGDGLLTSEEPLHLRQRKLMQPAFHRDRIHEYARVMVDCAAASAAEFSAGHVVDIAAAMGRLALSIVSRTLFSTNTGAQAARIAASLDVILQMLNRLVLPPGPLRLAVPLPSTLRYRRALRDLDEILFGLIKARRTHGPAGGDLLDLLMAAEDPETGRRMNARQLRDEVVTLFVAGHETTANALTWTWYELARNPDVRRRLEEELARVLGSRPPAPEDYPRLPYLERVVSESLRLHPPVWILGRRPLAPLRFAGVEAGRESVFLVCMRVLHRHPALWPDPERFDPDRFLPAAREARDKFAYLPFGAGSRLCIGERFAWMETVLAVAAIARRWRFDLVDPRAAEPLALITLRPKGGLKVRPVPTPGPG